jgi:putative membrane protein
MAWVLLDGNNMVCGLREPLRNAVLEMVDEAELLTTDNHIVNVLVGGFNPIGLNDPDEMIMDAVVRAMKEALADLKDAEVAGTRVEVGDIMVFGKGNTIRLSNSVNSAVATARSALLAAFGFASVVSAFALWLLQGGL